MTMYFTIILTLLLCTNYFTTVESQHTVDKVKHGLQDFMVIILQLRKDFEHRLDSLQESMSQLSRENAALQKRVNTLATGLDAQSISFTAYLQNKVDPGSDGIIVFERADHNVGGHYDSSTGKFTCPMAATYYFSMMMSAQIKEEPDGIQYTLLRDGSTIAQMYCDNILDDLDIYAMCGNSAIVHCDPGEEVYVQSWAEGDPIQGKFRTIFQGFLIHVDP